jgi:membrane-associated phospholipid phosphatase
VLAVIVSLVVSLSINAFWKISVHMLGQGGVFGSLLALKYVHMADVSVIAMLTIAMAALTGYSRVKLEAHTHGQVYAGFILGTAINWIIIANHWML